MLELERNRLDEAAAVIAKIRARWKDAATGDVLDAQLALKRGKMGEAIEHFDAALKKDPDNKIVQFWKAQLDGRTGAVAEAARRWRTSSATSRSRKSTRAPACSPRPSRPWPASRSRPATSTTRSGGSRSSSGAASTGTLSRGDRWQLITAYVDKGQWPQAKREIAAILNDAKRRRPEERVRGANFYRQQGESAAALAQIDYVLKVEPTNPAAVVTRSYILLQAKQHDQAATILRTAHRADGQGPARRRRRPSST